MQEIPGYPRQTGTVTVHAFGKPRNFYVRDWSDPRSFTGIFPVLRELGIRRAHMFIPGFNGHIVTSKELTVAMPSSDTVIYTGTEADAAILQPGEVFLIPPADCHTTVMYHKETRQAAVAHMARDMMLPLNKRMRRPPEASPISIVDNLLFSTKWRSRDLAPILVCVGIGPKHFGHPRNHEKYGPQNAHLLNFIKATHGPSCVPSGNGMPEGAIHQVELIRRQFADTWDLDPAHIVDDGIDTAGDDMREICWSNRRGEREGRNLVVVINGRQ